MDFEGTSRHIEWAEEIVLSRSLRLGKDIFEECPELKVQTSAKFWIENRGVHTECLISWARQRGKEIEDRSSFAISTEKGGCAVRYNTLVFKSGDGLAKMVKKYPQLRIIAGKDLVVRLVATPAIPERSAYTIEKVSSLIPGGWANWEIALGVRVQKRLGTSDMPKIDLYPIRIEEAK